MTNLVIYCLILLNLNFALASSDKFLRSKKVKFVIKKLSDKKLIYTLFNQDGLGLVLEKKENENSKIFRIENRELKALGQDFSKFFVKQKYLTNYKPTSQCKKVWDLYFHGDDLSLCSEDKVKVNELISFINKLENKLENKLVKNN